MSGAVAADSIATDSITADSIIVANGAFERERAAIGTGAGSDPRRRGAVRNIMGESVA